jgi:hypothetical protein
MIMSDISERILRHEIIDGNILPDNPMAIQVVGKSEANLQVRVIYRDVAPYYFQATRA